MAELPVIHGEIRLGGKEPLVVINEQSFHLEIQVFDGTTQKFLEAWIDSKKITKKEQTLPGDLTLIHPEAMTDLLLSEPSETLLIPAEAHKELPDTFIEKQKKTKVPAATTKREYLPRGLGPQVRLYALNSVDDKFTIQQYQDKIREFYKNNAVPCRQATVDSISCESLKEFIKEKKIVKLKSKQYKKIQSEIVKPKKQPDSTPEKFSSYTPQSFPTATEIIEKEIKEDKPPAESAKETAEKLKKEQEAETKRFHQKCTKKVDDIIKKSFDEHGVSGIYDQKLLSGFSMTEIRRRCQDLGLLDQYGLRSSHKGKQPSDTTEF